MTATNEEIDAIITTLLAQDDKTGKEAMRKN